MSDLVKESLFFICLDASRERFNKAVEAHNAQFADNPNAKEALKYMHSVVFQILLYQLSEQHDYQIPTTTHRATTVTTDREQIRRLLLQNKSSIGITKAVSVETVYRYLERLREAGIISRKIGHGYQPFELVFNENMIVLYDLKAEKAVNLAENETLSDSDLCRVDLAICKVNRISINSVKNIKSGMSVNPHSGGKDVAANRDGLKDRQKNEAQHQPKKPDGESQAPGAEIVKKVEINPEKILSRGEVAFKARLREVAVKFLLFMLGYLFARKPKQFGSMHAALLHTDWRWTNYTIHNLESEFQLSIEVLETKYFGHIKDFKNLDIEHEILKQCVRMSRERILASPSEKRKALDVSYLNILKFLTGDKFSLMRVRTEWFPTYLENNRKRLARRQSQQAENEAAQLLTLRNLRVRQIANAVLTTPDNEQMSKNAILYISNAMPREFLFEFTKIVTDKKPVKVKPDKIFTSIVLNPDEYLFENKDKYIAKFRTEHKKGKFHITKRNDWKFDENGHIIGYHNWETFKATIYKRYHNITIN